MRLVANGINLLVFGISLFVETTGLMLEFGVETRVVLWKIRFLMVEVETTVSTFSENPHSLDKGKG